MGADHLDTRHLQAAFAATVVDEWARCGLSHAVVCPGSRSTPMVMALAAHPAVKVHVRLDERSAAFTALGIGMASGRPSAVVTTSGTAAAELHPAVAEADRAGVPLIACTADIPPEVHGVGALQPIDQAGLYGAALRWFCDPGVAAPAARGMWRSLAARVVGEATGGPGGPGPVHLNLPFREPLLGDPERGGGVSPGRPGGVPWHAVVPVAGGAPGPEDRNRAMAAESGTGGGIAALFGSDGEAAGLLGAARGLVVAGGGSGDPGAVLGLAHALGWPVLADPRSGLRVRDRMVIAAADGILRAEQFAAAHLPEVVLHVGDRWLSRTVAGFLSRAHAEGARSISVDPFGRWSDPGREVHTFVRRGPTDFCRRVVEWAARPGGRGEGAPSGRSGPSGRDGEAAWAEEWHRAERRAQQAVDRVLGTAGGAMAGKLSEPLLARALVARMPEDATLMVSASMPIRDVESYGGPRPGPPRVLANRGANGIDGVVSTGLGVALANPGPTVALVGDLAFLHDVSGLLAGPDAGPDLTVVVADNRGGGIFSFLEVATALEESQFEKLFATPQPADPGEVASAFGWPVDDVDGRAGLTGVPAFEQALDRRLREGGRSVIRVRLPGRADNVAVHRRIDQAIADAVDQA